MAGIFDFGTETWDGSAGTFRAIANDVIAHLPANGISAQIRTTLQNAVDSNVMFIDFSRGFDSEMREGFKNALKLYLDRVIADGADSLENPALYEGFLAKMKTLMEATQRNIGSNPQA